MSIDYFWLLAGLAAVVAILALDALKRKQRADAEKHMTPEQREIARREAKAFQWIFRRGG